MEDREIKELSNDELYMKMLATIDPGLWRIKQKLLTSNVNPDALSGVIEALSNVYHSTKNGKVIIEIEDGIIKGIYGNSYRKVDINVIY